MTGFKSPQERQQYFRSQINTPEANGLFRAIAGPEGTLNPDGTFAYWRQFGGNDLDPSKLGPGHPNQVVRKNGYASAATGFLQAMPATWNGANKAMGGNLDFRKPEDQKTVLLYLASKRTEDIGGIASLKKGGLTPEFVAKLSPEWASLPTLAGKSYYGQPVKPYDWVKQKYDEGLKSGSGTEVASAGTTPATTTAPQSTTPVISGNEDGIKSVSVPGTEINITFANDKEKTDNFLRDYVSKQAWSGLLKDMTGGIDTNQIASLSKKLYPSIDDLLA